MGNVVFFDPAYSSYSYNWSQLRYSGGLDVYATRHFGFQVEVIGNRGISRRYASGNLGYVTMGLFSRTK
jgi:hypothetical protein